jgi:hypothetical protein
MDVCIQVREAPTMADEPSLEVVPGMAEAIATRMRELRIRPGRLAELSGLTPAGVMAFRKGYRRNYRDHAKWGMARALQWPADAIDRLLDGEMPPFDDGPEPGTPAAIDVEELGLAALAGELDGDPLTQEELAIATDLIRSIRRQRGGGG